MSKNISSNYNLRPRKQKRITQRFGERLRNDFLWSPVAVERIEILDSSSEEEHEQRPRSPNDDSLVQQFGRIEIVDSVEEDEGANGDQHRLFSYDEAEDQAASEGIFALSLSLSHSYY